MEFDSCAFEKASDLFRAKPMYQISGCMISYCGLETIYLADSVNIVYNGPAEGFSKRNSIQYPEGFLWG